MALPSRFVVSKNNNLLSQALRVYEWGKHSGTHLVKTRSDVNISKRKIYRQKHTGNARHGAKSAPIFVGGGVAHGPQGFKKVLSLPVAMKRRALEFAMGLKAKNGQVFVVSSIESITKTSLAQTFLEKVYKEYSEGSSVVVVLSEKNRKVAKFFRNIKNLKIVVYRNLNAYDVVLGGLVLLDQEIFAKKGNVKPKTKKI